MAGLGTETLGETGFASWDCLAGFSGSSWGGDGGSAGGRESEASPAGGSGASTGSGSGADTAMMPVGSKGS